MPRTVYSSQWRQLRAPAPPTWICFADFSFISIPLLNSFQYLILCQSLKSFNALLQSIYILKASTKWGWPYLWIYVRHPINKIDKSYYCNLEMWGLSGFWAWSSCYSVKIRIFFQVDYEELLIIWESEMLPCCLFAVNFFQLSSFWSSFFVIRLYISQEQHSEHVSLRCK